MVKVSKYTRRSSRGRRVKVSSHNRRATKRGRYNIERKRQLNSKGTNIFIDASIPAKDPGKRKSQSKRTYYERRFNRSDSGKFL